MRPRAGRVNAEGGNGNCFAQDDSFPLSIVRALQEVRHAVRVCVLEGDADAAARSVFDGLFGLAVEVVVLQAATGRWKGVRCVYGSTRDPPARQADEGSIAWMRMRKGCRKTRKGTKEGDVQRREEVFANVSTVLTRKRTLWGGGALEVGDLCLLEDGSERSGALGSDSVGSETASKGQDGRR